MRYSLGDIHRMHLEASERNDFKTLKKCEGLYLQILDQEPDNWTVLFLISGIYLATERNGLAIALLNRAASLKPGCAEVFNNLGTAYKRQYKHAEAERALRRAIELKPDDTDQWNNLGTMHINEGSPEQGLPAFDRALRLDPNNVHAHWNRALALLEMGRYAEGFKEYAWGLKSADRQHRTYGAPDWDGKHVGTLVVYGEQGIGDEIMFASLIEEARQRCDRLVFDCHPRLVSLFERSLGVECHGTRKDEITPWAAEIQIDAACPIGGLAQFFRRSFSDFPRTAYLQPDPERMDAMKKRLESLPTGLNVGIGWKGGKHKTRTTARSMTLDDMTPMLQLPNINWISLQYTPEASEEIAEYKKRTGLEIHHWPEVVNANNYDETAALVSALDLVISVNSSVVHLAGAMGQLCWTMTPVRKAWRYYSPDGSRMAWYGSVEQFTQERDGDWTAVIDRIVGELLDVMSPAELGAEAC